jgi:predicted RNA binding protein YcfA (HicA-like mRNA interferase family)
MPEGFYRQLVKLLRRAGYVHQGNFKGSHERWVHSDTRVTLVVPRNLHSRHTANAILSDAGVPHKF